MQDYKVLKSQADAACLGGHYEEATRLYGDAIKFIDQDHADICTLAAIHSNRCQCFLKLSRPEEAWPDAEAALRLRPRWPKAHLRTAQCYESQGKLEHAIASYKRAGELDPSLVEELSAPIQSLRSKLSRDICQAIFLPSTRHGVNETSKPPGAVYYAALSPQTITLGSISTCILAGAYADGSVRLWCSTLGTLIQTLTGHSQAVTTLTWSKDGSLLASGSLDTTARIWQCDNSDNNKGSRSCSFKLLSTLQGHSGRVSAVAFGNSSARGSNNEDQSSQVIITASTDLTVRIWNIQTGECLHNLGGHSALVSDIALDPGQGTLLASASGDAHFKLWNVSNGECLENVGWDSGPVVLCGFLPMMIQKSITHDSTANKTPPCGPLLITAHAQLMRQEGRVLLWDVLDKKDGWLDGHLVAPAWSIDGLIGRPTSWDAVVNTDGAVLLAVASNDGAVRVWDVTNGPLELFGFEVESNRLNNAAELPAWRAAALTQASNIKNLVKFSPNGSMLAASGATHVVSIRNIDNGTEICAVGGHSGRIRALEWLGNEALVTASEDGSMKKWRIAHF